MGQRRIKVKNKFTLYQQHKQEVFDAHTAKAIELVREHFMATDDGVAFEFKAMRPEEMPKPPYRYLYDAPDDYCLRVWQSVMMARAKIIAGDDFPHIWALRPPFPRSEVPELLNCLLQCGYSRERAATMLLRAIKDSDAKRGGITYAEQSPTNFRMLEAVASPEDEGKAARMQAALPESEDTPLGDGGDYRDALYEKRGRDALVQDTLQQIPQMPKPGDVLTIDAYEDKPAAMILTWPQFKDIHTRIDSPRTVKDVGDIIAGGHAAYFMMFKDRNGEGKAATGTIASINLYGGSTAVD